MACGIGGQATPVSTAIPASQSARMTLRPATVADAAELGNVHALSWRAEHPAFFPDPTDARRRSDPHWRATRWIEILTAEQSETVVAEDASRIVGFISYRDCEVLRLYVHPAHWGTGVGRALLENAEAALTAAGCVQARVWAYEQNRRAACFYSARGWEPRRSRAGTFGLVEVEFIRQHPAQKLEGIL